MLSFLWAVLSLAAPASAQVPRADVLYIGDSHATSHFGHELDRMIRTRLTPSTVTSYGSVGAGMDEWFNGWSGSMRVVHRPLGYNPERRRRILGEAGGPTPRITSLLRRYRPRLMVISLGGNNILRPNRARPDRTHSPVAIENNRAFNRRHIRQIVEEVRNYSDRCVWIGPPQGRHKPPERLQEFYDDLRAFAGTHCTIVDSRPVTPLSGTTSDGTHFRAEPSRLWAEYAFSRILPLLP